MYHQYLVNLPYIGWYVVFVVAVFVLVLVGVVAVVVETHVSMVTWWFETFPYIFKCVLKVTGFVIAFIFLMVKYS